MWYTKTVTKRLHDQRPEKRMMVCPNCKLGVCESCVDRLRLMYSDEPICMCGKNLHAEKIRGEANLKQIQDPETGVIHAPALTVDENGQVTFKDGYNPFE